MGRKVIVSHILNCSKLCVNLNVTQKCMFVNVRFPMTAILGSLAEF